MIDFLTLIKCNILKITASLIFCSLGLCSLRGQDSLSMVLKNEVDRQMSFLSDKENAPYYIHFRMVDSDELIISASLGTIT